MKLKTAWIRSAWIALAWAGLAASAARALEMPVAVNLRRNYEARGLTVRAQGSSSLCWAYALTGVLDYEFTVNARLPRRFSPTYFPWARSEMNHSQSKGCHVAQCLRALEQHGICQWALYPPNLPSGGAPSELALADAQAHRGLIEPRLLKLCNHASGLSDEQFQAIKESLAAGHPVAAGLYWPNKLAFTYTAPYVMATPPADGVHMGHFVVFAGYQDNPRLDGGGAFLVRNSLGESWGDQGYAWMPYAYAKAYTYDALAFRVRPRPVDFNPLAVNAAGRKLMEAEAMGITATRDLTAKTYTMKPISLQRWSGERQLFCEAAKPGGAITFNAPIETAGDYWIFAMITRAPNHGVASFAIDGQMLEAGLDGCGLDCYPASRVLLGKARLAAGRHAFTVTISNRSAGAQGYGYGLDALEFLPIQ